MTKKKSWRVKRRHWRHSISLDSLFQKTSTYTRKNEPLSQEMHLKILHLRSGLKMSGVVEKLLFIYSWNRYHQQIPGINLIHIGATSILLCQHQPWFHCWKDIWCWKLPCLVSTSENDRLHIYSLWLKLGFGTVTDSPTIDVKTVKSSWEVTIEASNFGPHGNFGPYLASSVASLDESRAKIEKNRVCKSKLFLQISLSSFFLKGAFL